MSNTFEEKPLPFIYEEDMTPPDDPIGDASEDALVDLEDRDGIDIFSEAGKKRLHEIENPKADGHADVPASYFPAAEVRRSVVLGLLDSGIGNSAEDIVAAAKVLTAYVVSGESADDRPTA